MKRIALNIIFLLVGVYSVLSGQDPMLQQYSVVFIDYRESDNAVARILVKNTTSENIYMNSTSQTGTLYYRQIEGNDFQVQFGIKEEDHPGGINPDWELRCYKGSSASGTYVDTLNDNGATTWDSSSWIQYDITGGANLYASLYLNSGLFWSMQYRNYVGVTIVVDGTCPSISITAANNDPLNQSYNDQILLRKDVPLFFRFSDTLSGFKNVKYTYLDDVEISIAPAPTTPAASWTYSTTNPSQLFIQQSYLDTLTEGAHNLRIVASDNVGNLTEMTFPVYFTKLQKNLALTNTYIDDLGIINANYPNVKTVKAVDSTLNYLTTFSDALLATASNYTGYKIMALPPNTTNMIELTTSLIRNETTVLSEKTESTFEINKAALEEGVWQFQVVSAFMVNGIEYLGYPSLPIKVLIKNSGTNWGIFNLHENTQTLLLNWDYNTENAGSKEFLNGFKVIIKRQEAIAPIETDWNAPNLFRDSFYDLTPLKTKIPLKLFLRTYDIFGNMNETMYNFTLPNRSYAISKTGANNLYVQGPGVETPTQTYSEVIPEIKLNKIYDNDGDELKFMLYYRKVGTTSFKASAGYVSGIDLSQEFKDDQNNGAYEWYVKIGEFYDFNGDSADGKETRYQSDIRTIPATGQFFTFSYASIMPKSPKLALSDFTPEDSDKTVTATINSFQADSTATSVLPIKYLYLFNFSGSTEIPTTFIDYTTAGSIETNYDFLMSTDPLIIDSVRNGTWIRIEVSNIGTKNINMSDWPVARKADNSGYCPVAVISQDVNGNTSSCTKTSVQVDTTGSFLTFHSESIPFNTPNFTISYSLLKTVQSLSFSLYHNGETPIYTSNISGQTLALNTPYNFEYTADAGVYGLYRLEVAVTVNEAPYDPLEISFIYNEPAQIMDLDNNGLETEGVFNTTIGVPVTVPSLAVLHDYEIIKWTWELDIENDATPPVAQPHRSGEYNFADGAILIDLEEASDGRTETKYIGTLFAWDEYGLKSEPYGLMVIIRPTPSGTLIKSEKWNGMHEITGALEVPQGLTLTIGSALPAGGISVSALQDEKILINGTLNIMDGATIKLKTGLTDVFWYGFFISDTGDVTVGDAIISGAYRAFVLNGGELSLSWTNIKENFIGLHLLEGTISATSCNIINNEVYGVKIEDPLIPIGLFSGCNISGNLYNFFTNTGLDMYPQGNSPLNYTFENEGN